MSARSCLAGIAALDLFLVAGGTIGARFGYPFIGVRADTAFLMFAVAAVGVLTFFGGLWLGSSATTMPNEQSLRTSITVAIITVYLVVVGEGAFWATELHLASITDTILTSFTSIVGVVVAFFFGSSAYVEAKKLDLERGGRTS